jgi:hypothetical protein
MVFDFHLPQGRLVVGVIFREDEIRLKIDFVTSWTLEYSIRGIRPNPTIVLMLYKLA